MCAEPPSCPVCGTTSEFSALYLHLQTQHSKSDVSRALLHEIAPYPPNDLSFFHDDGETERPENGFKGAGTAARDDTSGMGDAGEEGQHGEEPPLA